MHAVNVMTSCDIQGTLVIFNFGNPHLHSPKLIFRQIYPSATDIIYMYMHIVNARSHQRGYMQTCAIHYIWYTSSIFCLVYDVQSSAALKLSSALLSLVVHCPGYL